MKILVIGSGGREHCLVWKLAQSPLAEKIYCAPGNGGTGLAAQNVDIAAADIEGLLDFALQEGVDLTVVGPEAPLVAGIVDKFENKGLKIFGPGQELSRLEGSKVFTKNVLKKYGIPTADFEVFNSPGEAKRYVAAKRAPIVVKADGLAAGKGVIVCPSIEEANQAVDLIMAEKKFGKAGDRIVVEDCLAGEEASILIFTDGDAIVPLVSAQDHKPAYDGDTGPNTGGMGAYAPAPLVDNELLNTVVRDIFQPLIAGLKKESKAYKGMLYAGLMIKDNQPYVLEFNVRFGDPEIQAILPKLKSDLVEVMLKTIDSKLNEVILEWDERFCLCVVLASGGYPGSYEKGKEITGLEELKNMEDIFVFHAGTKLEQRLVTSGGRVLNIAGVGKTIKEARNRVYKAIEKVHFEKMHYRKDIGSKALTKLPL